MLRFLSVLLLPISVSAADRPHVVFFVADDMGHADVGFNGGKDIKTPNLDNLAAAGANLTSFYVQPVCSPTRAALMTGRYPIRHGLQVGVVRPWAQYGLPLDERTLPQALKEVGYKTAIVGKWHLGHFQPEYLPTRRGFDHQYGHYNGALDYFTHDRDGGFDWHRDDKVCRDEGYSTHLLAKEACRLVAEHDPKAPLFLYVPFNAVHSPHQVPQKYKEPYAKLPEPRRTYAGMLAAMDEAIGQVVAAVEKRGMRRDTLFVFSSDNGGPQPGTVTDNGKLRAGKGTVYEGGVRVAACAAWDGHIKPGSTVNEPLHMVDWYPTLLKLTGAKLDQKLPLDGMDAWPTLSAGKPTPHKEILLNATPTSGGIRVGDWKLVVNGGRDPGDTPAPKKKKAKDGPETVELFNLAVDLSEAKNLAAEQPGKVKELRARLDHYRNEAVPPKVRRSRRTSSRRRCGEKRTDGDGEPSGVSRRVMPQGARHITRRLTPLGSPLHCSPHALAPREAAPMRFRLSLLALFLALPALADWKPAPAPLMTRWGKAVTPANAWQEYPRPQLVRKEWQNLNGLWDYAITAKDAKKPEKWDGQILVPFFAESALSGVGKTVTKDQNLWYRRTLLVPPSWKGQRLILRFEAVDFETTVWVNGKEFPTHRGMSDPFSFDVTDALKDGRGELVVRVWDPTDSGAQPRGKQVKNPGGIWYTLVTGIWQTVWMEPVPEGHVVRVEALPDIDQSEVTFRVEVAGAQPGDRVNVSITETPGRGLGTEMAVGKPITLKLRNPELWSPDQPHLYKFTVVLRRGKQFTDQVFSYFAMRKVSVGKDDKGVLRLMLNNKPLFQVGPLDQGWWPDGLLTPPSEEAMVYDLKVLKQLGLNMLRKHIKVEPSRYYYHCDKLGLLVWQDMPSGGIPALKQHIAPNAKDDATFSDADKKQFRIELKAMIDHLRFFPCIYCWVPFNEGWGQHDTNEILKWTKEYDPSRLVNGPSGWTDRDYGDMKDMHMYPGPGMFPVMPDRVSVLGEFGGLGLPLPGHLWKDNKKNWGYRTYDTTQELREQYRRLTVLLRPLIGKGLAAAIYTQTTDVEVEVNGYLTYDREVLKFDPVETAKWHKSLFGPPPSERVLVETSEKAGQKWRYTTEKPADGWEKPDFNAGMWKEGEGGFGTAMTPGTHVRTNWKTNDIWLRREVELKAVPAGELLFRLHHDEDAQIYINGVLAGRVRGFVTDYTLVSLTPEGRKALKAGKNVLAVHCRQTGGGQYIDVGMVELIEGK